MHSLPKRLLVFSLLNFAAHTTLACHEQPAKHSASAWSNKALSALNSPWGMIDSTSQLPIPLNGHVNPDKNGSQALTNYQPIMSGYCAIHDSFCFFRASNGTITEATATDLSDQCLLWDDSCSGNKTTAITRFFNTTIRDEFSRYDPCISLICNQCFVQEFMWSFRLRYI